MTASPMTSMIRGIVPVYANDDASTVTEVMAAHADGGVRAFAYTNRTPDAEAIVRRQRTVALEHHPRPMLGVGTILDGASSTRFLEAGADFVVAPSHSHEVGRRCTAAGVPFIPGVWSPQDVCDASRNGQRLFKLLPTQSGGPAHLRALRGPFQNARFIVTGGMAVHPESVAGWIQAGAVAIGLGSNLFPSRGWTDARLEALRHRTAERVQGARETLPVSARTQGG